MNQKSTQSPAEDIQANLQNVRLGIKLACEKFGRDPDHVALLAVSKTKPVSMIASAIALGQIHFGENYLQDALTKIEEIKNQAKLPKPIWHYIGAIQSNKTRPIAEHFDWVHTVSSHKIAKRLSDQRPSHMPPLNILLQVNIDAEPTKSGVKPEQLLELIQTILELPGIQLRGLMAIPAPASEFELQRAPFKALGDLKQQCIAELGSELQGFDQLSMGMTGDLEAAIAEGATWLRIGTAIFGERN
jgi:pyridoxal phosphate enzyme (YggS family)